MASFQMKPPGKTPQTFKMVELSGFDPALVSVELFLPCDTFTCAPLTHPCLWNAWNVVCGMFPFQPFLVCGMLACASLTSSSLSVGFSHVFL